MSIPDLYLTIRAKHMNSG